MQWNYKLTVNQHLKTPNNIYAGYYMQILALEMLNNNQYTFKILCYIEHSITNATALELILDDISPYLAIHVTQQKAEARQMVMVMGGAQHLTLKKDCDDFQNTNMIYW